MVSVNQLVAIVADVAGIKLKRSYNLDAVKGVMGPQQRQYADPGISGLGAEYFTSVGYREGRRMNLRPVYGTSQVRGYRLPVRASRNRLLLHFAKADS